MAKQVSPVIARKGTYLATYKASEKSQMLAYCKAAELTIKRNEMADKKEIVYTRIGKGTQPARFDTWQVYVVNK